MNFEKKLNSHNSVSSCKQLLKTLTYVISPQKYPISRDNDNKIEVISQTDNYWKKRYKNKCRTNHIRICPLFVFEMLNQKKKIAANHLCFKYFSASIACYCTVGVDVFLFTRHALIRPLLIWNYHNVDKFEFFCVWCFIVPRLGDSTGDQIVIWSQKEKLWNFKT